MGRCQRDETEEKIKKKPHLGLVEWFSIIKSYDDCKVRILPDAAHNLRAKARLVSSDQMRLY